MYRKPLSTAKLVSLVTIVSCASPAVIAGGIEIAPSNSGFYITAGAGGASYQAESSNISLLSGGINTNSTAELMQKNSLNFTWNGGIGWQFNSFFRMDLMYVYMNLPLQGYFTATAISGAHVLSLANILTRAVGVSNMEFIDAYVNIMSLFSARNDFFQPYVGAGVGAAQNQLINFKNVVFSPAISFAISNGYQNNFAWRAVAGLNFSLTRHLQAYTQYSFISAGNYVTGNTVTGINLPITGSVPTPASYHIYTNMLGAGLTYLF